MADAPSPEPGDDALPGRDDAVSYGDDAVSFGDGAAVRLPPPLVYLGGVISGVLLRRFVAPLDLGLPLTARAALTVVLAAAAIGLLAAALGLFRSSGQDPKPWKSTPEILSTGIYRFTRNPMYLGMGLLQAAIGVGLDNGWILVLVPVVLITVQFTAIRHEEAYLEAKFGEGYTRYRSSVRRWL